MADVLLAVVGLSLAVALGYLVRNSSALRNLVGLTDDTDQVHRQTQTVGTSTDPELDFHRRPATENCSTQTSTDHVTSPFPSSNIPPSSSIQSDNAEAKQSSSSSASAAAAAEKGILATTASGPSSISSSSLASIGENQTEKLLPTQMVKLAEEIEHYKQVVGRIEAENRQLRDRLAEQAESQLTKGPSKFENLSLGENRPSMLIKRYSDLYSEGRAEAWDALDDLTTQEIDDDKKEKLLFSIVVICFRQAGHFLSERLRIAREAVLSSAIRSGKKDPEDGIQLKTLFQDIDESIEAYFRRTVSRYDISENFEMVTTQLWSKLVHYPSLRECEGLLKYIEECLRIAWALTVQNPPYVVDFDDDVYCDEKHSKFHTSDSDENRIESFLWPALVEKPSGHCVSKGVVVTKHKDE